MQDKRQAWAPAMGPGNSISSLAEGTVLRDYFFPTDFPPSLSFALWIMDGGEGFGVLWEGRAGAVDSRITAVDSRRVFFSVSPLLGSKRPLRSSFMPAALPEEASPNP